MATWAEDIAAALERLGGIAKLAEIYDVVSTTRQGPHPRDLGASVRGCIERHSSDSSAFAGKDLFYSVNGIGGGIWGLRSFLRFTPLASDIVEDAGTIPERRMQETYRILRDTALARKIKLLHANTCQICGESILLKDSAKYSEAHHIRPLGYPHHGPDVSQNIIVLCANHHVLLDYGVLLLNEGIILGLERRAIGQEYIDYHNRVIAGSVVGARCDEAIVD